MSDVPPPMKIYPNAATGKNIFIYEDGKKVKEDLQFVSGGTEKGEEKGEDKKEMDWEPPPLFGDDVGDGKEENGVKKQTPLSQAPPAQSSSSSSSSTISTPSRFVDGSVPSGVVKSVEEERKRMDIMEKEMLELKNKMSCLENSMAKNNEDVANKFNAIELQQQSANVDIKNMFSQLMSEMGSIKTTISTTAVMATNTEEQRKKPRVDSPAPMNN
jgi:hypothetical protein